MLLDNHNGSNETEILNRINQARSEPEPLEPTDETESIDIEPEDIELEESETVDETMEESSEIEPDESEEQQDDEIYVDFNGREVSFSQIKEWEQGHLMQSDYTRKTQKLADERKSLEARQEALTAKTAELDEKILSLDSFISDFDNSTVDGMTLEELRDIDPSQYIKVKEDNEKRKKALDAAKKARSGLSSEEKQENERKELSSLLQSNPQWLKDGKETKEYQNDMSLVKSYLDSLGLSESKQKGILTNGHGQAYIDAARFHAGKKVNASIAKKVRKAPVVTKPSGASKSVAATKLEKAKANHRKFGTVETAMALRKAQKQFKGK